MQFSPPVCCQLSQAGTSSLLRIHLPPHTASVGLEFPLVPAWKPSLYGRSGARLPQLLRVSCERPHPQSHRRSDQVWGFTIFGTLTHLQCRIWFAFAVCRSLPIASFRPCRYQQRPCNLDCLPPGRGDACFFQQTGWTRHAGQTKKPRSFRSGAETKITNMAKNDITPGVIVYSVLLTLSSQKEHKDSSNQSIPGKGL